MQRESPLQMSPLLLTQHINNHCQSSLKQTGSTSLVLINRLPRFPMILSMASRDGLQLGILGVDPGSASHWSHDLSIPSITVRTL